VQKEKGKEKEKERRREGDGEMEREGERNERKASERASAKVEKDFESIRVSGVFKSPQWRNLLLVGLRN
jgi:hypothetical protein